MAEGPSSNSTQDFFFFLALIGGLFVLWLATGGPERTPTVGTFQTRGELRSIDNLILEGKSAQAKKEIERNLVDVERELEQLEEDLRQARLRGVASPYEGMVEIRGGRARERFAQTEYLELVASRSNERDVLITGWVLESVVTGQRGTIGQVARLPYPGEVNITFPLLLSPGDKVTVTTGASPIGANFKVNQCVGYFEQFQNFSPRLRRECTNPTDEFDEFSTIQVTNVRLEDDEREICREFIRRDIDRCEINRTILADVEPRLRSECRDFIEETYTYSGCVANHSQDTGFFENEWRVFLGSYAELWREDREIIRLLDQNGRTVDIYDY